MPVSISGDGIISGVSSLTTPLTGITSFTNLNISGVTTVSAGSASSPSITPSGDSNTGVFFPAADTVCIGEGGVEVFRVNSNGYVGIGTTNPDSTLDVNGEITIRRTAAGSEGGQVNFARASDNTVAWNIDAFGATSTPSLRFIDAIAGASRAGIDSSGNFTVSSGNIIIGTSGKGIDFSATANSSGTMTSELLSDYEEGTWTPVYFLGGVQQSYNTDILAYYTKIGRMVYVNFWTGWGAYGRDNFPSGSGSRFEIGGLPYSITETYRPGTIGQARTQGGLSTNFSIGADNADRICFYGTGGSFGGWAGSAGLAASSISSIAAPVIAGAFWYIN